MVTAKACENLLDGFVQICRKNGQSRSNAVATHQQLLDGFLPIYRMSQTEEAQDAKRDRDAIASLLNGFDSAVQSWRESQKEKADDFNLLEVMQLTGKEIRHSMVLAWLLDWDLSRAGTHAQGNLGFRLFLEELQNELHLDPSIAAMRYHVRREVADDESRLDIQISARGHFLVGIEVKIWANEGVDQTNREWKDLNRRAEQLQVPKNAMRAIFLTPEGASPANENFISISWHRLARVFEAFAKHAVPEDVRLFASHYARSLGKFIITESEDEESENGGQTV